MPELTPEEQKLLDKDKAKRGMDVLLDVTEEDSAWLKESRSLPPVEDEP